VKNEITAHASALEKYYPKARTVIENWRPGFKIIIFKNGIPVDFGNEYCLCSWNRLFLGSTGIKAWNSN